MTFKEFYFRHNNRHYRGVGVKWSRVTVAGEMSHGDSTPTRGKKTHSKWIRLAGSCKNPLSDATMVTILEKKNGDMTALLVFA